MKGEVVNLHRERWLGLANAALEASATLQRGHVEALGTMATRMQNATPPYTDQDRVTGCLAFRWTCQHFALMEAEARPGFAPVLQGMAQEIRRLFDHHPAPMAAASVAVPVQQSLDMDPPSWARRADIGG